MFVRCHLSARVSVFVYVHFENNESGNSFVKKYYIKGNIRGRGFELSDSEMVIFRSKTARDYENITGLLKELRAVHPELSVAEYIVDNAEKYRLLAQYEKQYSVEKHEPVEMFRGNNYFAGDSAIMAELQRLKERKAPTRAIKNGLQIQYFYSAGCKGCREIKENLLPVIEDRYDGRVKFVLYDIGAEDNYTRLIALEKRYNVKTSAPITMFVEGQCLQGKEQIINRLDGVIAKILSDKMTLQNTDRLGPDVETNDEINYRFKSMGLITIISAGLIDGVNPCVFAAIIFFMSFLIFAGKSKREILIIGMIYVLTVFIT